jgi:hypothetical protein
MKVGAYFQCTKCGAIHYIEYPYKAEELYSSLWCEECEKDSRHLWVGNDICDKYLYYDITMDERYFLY